ncbi:aquaporin Z [Cupriavidus gilardii J11]|uniref:Aquaporin Z n=1 Tax=Cupriavidus gilardii J11 TaxID=936133 RepID=A0A562B9Z5_9BURK|nr:aquaporin Z [Cupriavidus gilardii]TWG81848.1 aquaporin Z [Cupriavidus gilardii J11]
MDLKRPLAEAIGTFWLVFGGCGSAVLAAGFPQLGIGFAGVSLAFGLTVLTMACAIGPVSGCHLNPAVTVGLATAGRFAWRDAPLYIVAQVIGGALAALVLFELMLAKPGFDLAASGLAANGFGAGSPSGFGLAAVFVTEALATFFFVLIIAGATSPRAHGALAPVAIGLALTLIHLITIPVSNTSVNPARSTGPALIVGGMALQQLWLFWVAPIVGAVAAGFASRLLYEEKSSMEPTTETIAPGAAA